MIGCRPGNELRGWYRRSKLEVRRARQTGLVEHGKQGANDIQRKKKRYLLQNGLMGIVDTAMAEVFKTQ